MTHGLADADSEREESLSGGASNIERPWSALSEALRAMAIMAVACGYVIAVATMIVNDLRPRWDLYLAPIVLMVAGTATLTFRAPYRTRATLLSTAFYASCLLADLSTGSPQAQFLYPLACVLSAILLGPWVALLVAGLGTASLLAAGWLASGWGSLPLRPAQGGLWALALLWLAAAAMWASVGSIYFAIRRAEASEKRAWQHAHEADIRRGELGRAKKALNDMYNLLQRTNFELAVARREAEEAQHIKAQFAANISHELRTPLNLIMGFAEMIYHSPGAYGNVRWTPALSADIGEIYQSSRHLLGMIDDILDLSRVEAQRLPLDLQLTDLRELIRETTSTVGGLLRGKEVALVLKLPPSLPEVLVDRMRIRQVLINLLNNAIRFTDRGTITVSAEEVGGEIAVAVSDTGVGIPPEEMATIFEEFGQARDSITSGRGGAGLGLAICRQFVRLHGGHIEAESQPDQGSTFRFKLPLPDSGRARSRLSYYAPEGWTPPTPVNPLGKTAIVLGSDEEAVRALARAIEGYHAIPADSLHDLAPKVEAEHPAGIVLVSDPLSPNACEPAAIWEAAGRADLPIVRCELPLASLARRHLGVAGYLVKPVQRQQLLAAIKEASPQPQSILVVDDDPSFVAFVNRILEAELPEADLWNAYAGAEALAILAKRSFDAVILDLVMPEVDGLRVIEALRQDVRLAGTPIIVTTGSSYGDEVARLHPGRIELLRREGCDRAVIGNYVKALLDVAPPDYCRPTPPGGQPAFAAGTQVS